MADSNLAVVALARDIRDRAVAQAVAENWKMSTAEVRQLLWTVDYRDERMTIDRAKYMHMVEGFDADWIMDLLRMKERWTTLDAFKEFIANKPEFPLNGFDLIERGYKGAEIGRELERVKGMWAMGGYKATREEVLYMVRKKV